MYNTDINELYAVLVEEKNLRKRDAIDLKIIE